MTPSFLKNALFAILLFATPAWAETPEEIPFREDAGLTKVEFLLTRKKFSAALDEIDAVLKRHPQSADAFAYRGYTYLRLGETAKAEEALQNALHLKPLHLGANKYMADIHLEKDDTARALEQLQVMRMACGKADCEEVRALEAAIDAHKRGPKEK